MPKLRALLDSPPQERGDAETQLRDLRDYLIRITEELEYILTHLEADNTNSTLWDDILASFPPYNSTPRMDGGGSAGGSSRWARGDHQHPRDTSKADATALTAHTGNTANPHGVTKTQVGLGNVDNVRQYSASNPPPIPTPSQVGAIPATDKGNAGGVAELDANGMVPSAQLPSYVDDVLEYASLSAFPAAGESGKIYVALDTNKTYRWSGSAYAEISESLALGETSSTAYRGDRGKTAYDHSQVTSGNPHNVSASDVGLGNVDNVRQYSASNPPPLPTPADIGAASASDLSAHTGDTNNPHGVTAAQVGLGNVDNVQQYSASNPPPVPDAEDIGYDNTVSGLTASDVQAAIDEIAAGGGGGGPSPASTTPVMDGTGAVGVSLLYAREDHEHPTDTSRAPSGYGLGVALASLNQISDANAITQTGWYVTGINNATTNLPPQRNAATAGAILAVVRGNAYQHQIYYDYYGGKTYERFYNESGWSDWALSTPSATAAELAVVESGSTASRNYSVGDLFCWKGLLYRVTSAISSGASFTVGANCEQTTVADEIADNAPAQFGLGIMLNTLSAVADVNNIDATGFYNTQQNITENLPVAKSTSAANGAILSIVRGTAFQYQIWVDYTDAKIYHRIKRTTWGSWAVLASL